MRAPDRVAAALLRGRASLRPWSLGWQQRAPGLLLQQLLPRVLLQVRPRGAGRLPRRQAQGPAAQRST